MSMSDLSVGVKLSNAALVMVIGLVVVFIALALLIAICYASGAFFSKKKKAGKEPLEAPVVNTARTNQYVQQPVLQDNAGEIAAVIAAVTALITAEQDATASTPDAAEMAAIVSAIAQEQPIVSKVIAANVEIIEGFHVRRIRRTSGANAWGKAGREEQLASKNYN